MSAKRPRLVAAVLLSLVAAGLGHMAIGHWRRGAAWYGVMVGLSIGMIACVLLRLPAPFWALLLVAMVLRLVAVVDTVRLPRPESLPGGKGIAIIALGLLVFYEILAGHARKSLVEAFQPAAGSMLPTLAVGDNFWVDKLAREYRRGDVVVFRYPLEQQFLYVKRIVGLPGDTIELRQGHLLVNGTPVERKQATEPCPTERPCTLWRERLDGREYLVMHEELSGRGDFGPRTVPADHVFVVGDNRDNSNDSRVYGPVSRELVQGRATWMCWSSGPEGVHWDRVNQPIR